VELSLYSTFSLDGIGIFPFKTSYFGFPCRIIRGLTPEQKLERRLIENIHHEPLTDLEEAKAIKRYIELKGCSERQAACHLGMSHTQIQYLLSLVEAPHEVKRLVEEGKLDSSTAVNYIVV
jgi:ParB/RepB/Spo0J family partition protein